MKMCNNMLNVEEVKCSECPKMFFRNTKRRASSRRVNVIVRPMNSTTCGRACSRTKRDRTSKEKTAIARRKRNNV